MEQCRNGAPFIYVEAAVKENNLNARITAGKRSDD